MKTTLYTNRGIKNSISRARKRGIEFGNGLGMFEDEYSQDECMKELVIVGPKVHRYRTSKDNVVYKQKGIAIDSH